jgi:hypothetical protein
MAANTAPIFTRLGDAQWTTSAMTSANNTYDLTSGVIYPVFTADTTNGGFVQRIRFKPLGTNGAATVCRVFINNGLTTATAANNTMWDEISLPTTTASATAALATYELPLNIALPASYRIYCVVATAPTSAGWNATVIGGKY